MSQPYRNAWEDQNVKAALKQRPASQVMLICCPLCHNYGYYNEGSHWSCSVGDCGGFLGSGELDAAIDAGEVITLDDYTDMEVNAEELP